jgi:hypothetical protein
MIYPSFYFFAQKVTAVPSTLVSPQPYRPQSHCPYKAMRIHHKRCTSPAQQTRAAKTPEVSIIRGVTETSFGTKMITEATTFAVLLFDNYFTFCHFVFTSYYSLKHLTALIDPS